MTKDGRKKNHVSGSIEDVSRRIEKIEKLEDEIIDLKKGLLFEEAASGAVSDTDMNFLIVNVANRMFAAPLKYIVEVVEMPAISPLPSKLKVISGLVNYHGQLLAVIDLEELLGNENTPVNSGQSLVVCNTGHRKLALKVDEALEVVKASPEDITISEQVLPGIFKTIGVLMLDVVSSALILDIGWLAVGAELSNIVGDDAVVPAADEKR